MVFGGIQKLTLLDYPEKTACTLFTIGCNFRCPFCHNTMFLDPHVHKYGNSLSLDFPVLHDESEILSFLKTRHGLLDGVCISGGEPLMQNGLNSFISKVKELGFLVKLDTNGNYPQKLAELINSGNVDYVAMDIKNSPAKYGETIGLAAYNIAPIAESMEVLRSSSIDYEYRTTVVREFHTQDDLISIARWITETASLSENADIQDKYYKYFLQGFIDSDGVLQKGLSGYTAEEMQQILGEVQKVLPTTELRGI